MATIANLLIALKADFGDADSKFKNLHRNLEDVGDESEKTGNIFERFLHHIHDGGEQAEDAGEKFSEFGKELFKLGTEILEVTSAFEVLKESVEVSAELESTAVAMEAFTGSAQTATEIIEQMEALSKSEALKFPEILPAAQHFLALGFSTESLAPAMAAAGNASWALGTSIESVTQRMGMMAEGGMVSGRFLRSLGISLEDLAKVMGITASTTAELERKVREAFRGMDPEDRLGALTIAMGKFGDLGAKEAETVAGKWIELKNVWHTAFLAIGDDLKDVTGFLERFGITMGNFLKDAFSNTPGVDALANLIRAIQSGTSYEEASAKSKEESFMGPVASEKTGPPAPHEDETAKKSREAAQKALAEAEAAKNYEINKAKIDAQEKHQKEMLTLIRNYYRAQETLGIASAEETNKRLVSVREDELKIELDAIAKKKSAIGALAGPKPEEYAKGVTTLGGERQAAIDKAAVDIQQLKFTLAEKTEKLQKQMEDHELKIVETLGQDLKFRETSDELMIKAAEGAMKVAAAEDKSTESLKEQVVTARRLAEERAFGVGIHTLAEQIENTRVLSGLEVEMLNLKAEQAQEEARIAELVYEDSGKEEDRAKAIAAAAAAQAALNAAKNAGYAAETKIQQMPQTALNATGAKSLVDLNKELASAQYNFATAVQAGNIPAADRLKLFQAVLDAQLELDRALGRTVTGGGMADQLKGVLNQFAATMQQWKSLGAVSTIGGGMSQAFTQAPAAIGGAMANSILGPHQRGETIGKQIQDAMKNVGKEMLGGIFTKLIEQLVAQVTVMILGHTIMAANTAALAANTAAMLADTASNYARIATLGFAEGGRPTPGVPIIVGEKGPEPFIPDVPGTIVPHDQMGDIMAGAAKMVAMSNSTNVGTMNFHAHGMTNPKDFIHEVARQLPRYLKSTSPNYSPASK